MLDQIAGGIMGIMANGIQNDYNEKRAEEQGRDNYMYGEMAAEEAYRRQKEMYELTRLHNSPAEKVKQLEDAGLSVGLMMGGSANTGGAGIMGSPIKGTGNAGIAPNQSKLNESMMMGMQMAQTKSQIAVNEADARLKNADADKKEGVDTENTIANTALTKANTETVEIANRISKATENEQVETVITNLENLKIKQKTSLEELQGLVMANKITAETMQTQIDTYKAQYENIIVDTLLKGEKAKTEGKTRDMLQKQMEKIVHDMSMDSALRTDNWENAEKDRELKKYLGELNAEIQGNNNTTSIITTALAGIATLITFGKFPIKASTKVTSKVGY